MANIEFFTGFEGCGSNADVQAFFDGINHATYTTYSATGGYDNGKCVKSPSSSFYLGYIACAAAKTKAFGLHVKGLGTSGYNLNLNYHLFRVLTVGGSYIRVFNTSSGLEVYRDSTLIASCTEKITVDLTHVEIKIYSHASAGTVQIRINGGLVIDASGLNTTGGDITSILIGNSRTANVYFDNIFIADDWCGELKSYLVKPSSDVVSDFTPSAGSDNYAMVDDAAQDGDTTYVEADTVGHADLYGYEDVPTDITIKAVSIVTVAKKTDAGDRAIKHIARQDAVDYDLDELYLGTSYPSGVGSAVFEILNTAPDGSAWTPSIFNAISWGFEVSA